MIECQEAPRRLFQLIYIFRFGVYSESQILSIRSKLHRERGMIGGPKSQQRRTVSKLYSLSLCCFLSPSYSLSLSVFHHISPPIMKIATAVISLVQVAALVARGVDGNNKEASVANVPSFTVQELLLAQRDPELVSILTTTGLLTVSLDDNDDAFSSMDVLQGLCDCPDFLTIDGTDTVVLDGDTVRSTLATATVGTTTPLPLSDGVGTACGSTLQQDLEQVRDHVATASSAFTVALDRIMGTASSSARPLMRDAKHSNKVYPTVSSITASANHLEHFHIYEKGEQQSSEEKDKTLDWHTDAGLFLSFVPGQECGSGLTDDTFYFRNSEEEEVSAMFSANSVAIMLGVGAQHWIMSSSLPLKATQHAVQMTEGSKRVWYGMSKLLLDCLIAFTLIVQRLVVNTRLLSPHL